MTRSAISSSAGGVVAWLRAAPSGVARIELAAIAVGAAVLAMYARYLNPRRPGVTTPEGFYGFYDQGEYLTIAQRLSEFSLPVGSGEYTYGLGYPLFGALGLWLGFDGDPFVLIDVVAFAFAVPATAVVGARLRSRNVGLVSAALVAFATPVLELMSLPWNSTLVVVAMLASLLFATSSRPHTALRLTLMGVIVGVVFATRYPDMVAVGLVAVIGLVGRPRFVKHLLILSAGVVIIVVPVLWSHQHVLGSWTTTPYASHVRADGTSDQSFGQYSVSRIPRHSVEVFVTATHRGEREPRDPLLLRSPFFVLAPLGALALMRVRDHRRLVVIVTSMTSVAFTSLYLSFVAGGGGDIKFGNFRYFVVWMPLWTVFAVAGGSTGLAVLLRTMTQRTPSDEAVTTPSNTHEPDSDHSVSRTGTLSHA